MLCPSQSHAACFLTHPDCISSFLKICFCVYLRFLFFFLNQVLMSDPLQMSPSPSQVDTSVSTDHCSVVLLLLWAPVVCGSPVSCVCSVLSKEAWFTIPLFLFFLFLFWLSKRVWTHCIFVLLMSPHVRGPWWGFSARPYVWFGLTRVFDRYQPTSCWLPLCRSHRWPFSSLSLWQGWRELFAPFELLQLPKLDPEKMGLRWNLF